MKKSNTKSELKKLQAARTKANQKRKRAYQAKVDAYFGLK